MNKENMLKAEVKGTALENITRLPDWKSIKDIFVKIYMDSIDELKLEENELARAKMVVIEEVYEEITKGIKLGKDCKKLYAEKYLGQIQNKGE